MGMTFGGHFGDAFLEQLLGGPFGKQVWVGAFGPTFFLGRPNWISPWGAPERVGVLGLPFGKCLQIGK